MIRIRSNIGLEITRLKKIQKTWAIKARAMLQDIPWRETAEAALVSAMDQSERRWLKAIIDGIAFEKIPTGLEIRVNPQGTGALAVGVAAKQQLANLNRGRPGKVSAGERLGFLSTEHAEAELSLHQENAEEMVRAWVYAPVQGGKYAPDRPMPGTSPAEDGKILTEEDDYNPEIAMQRVLSILGFRAPWPNAEDSEARLEAAQSLTRRIEEFIRATRGEDEEVGISAARLADLLRVIRDAWTELALVEVPQRILAALVAAGV